MLGYVTLGTNDLERAAKFYDAIAAAMGTKRMMEWPGAIAWGEPDGSAGIGLTKPFDGNTATVGNGVMAALAAKSKAQVRVSAVTGEGLNELVGALVAQASRALPKPGQVALARRQRALLGEVEGSLQDALSALDDPLLVAKCLRRGRVAFDALTGRAATEDMLDALFGRFCIGK